MLIALEDMAMTAGISARTLSRLVSEGMIVPALDKGKDYVFFNTEQLTEVRKLCRKDDLVPKRSRQGDDEPGHDNGQYETDKIHLRVASLRI